MDIPRLGVVELVRDTPDDIQDRWLRIRVDDAPEEILRYGETLRHDVPPGPHRIRAHNTLSRAKLDVDVAPGETVRVRCHNHFARGGILTMLTIGFGYIRVRLEVVERQAPFAASSGMRDKASSEVATPPSRGNRSGSNY